MHPAALWATVLAAAEGGSTFPVNASSTMPVAIVGGVSLVVVALIPEFFRWLRRHTPEVAPAAVVTPQALDAAEARVEVKVTQALERANAARAEVRALRKTMEARDESHRDDLQAIRDELNRHVWTSGCDPDGEIPAPREPAG